MQIKQIIGSRFTTTTTSILAALFLAGCVSLTSKSSSQLGAQIAQTDAVYRRLDVNHIGAYNDMVTSVARSIDGETPDQSYAQLKSIGVKLDQPDIKLPLRRCHVSPESLGPGASSNVGVPMLLDYDTSNAPLYPREGLLVSTTAVYRRIDNQSHLSLLAGKSYVDLNGATYALNVDNIAPITAMTRRSRRVARAGFSSMLDSAKMPVKTGIFLAEPYDPNKIPLLMVHGLQSTPFAFVSLINAIRRDPALSERFQVWTFLYGTGTPVLFNAFELRQELEKTVRELDPHDHDFATRHIVVLGHSMGGLMAHTLVSSSGNRIWNALFEVAPKRLRGDAMSIRRLSDGLHFHSNPRVVRVIFAATPHRGSKLAESWIGRIGASLIRLPSGVRTDVTKVISENQDVVTSNAQAFDRDMNFSAVHTLSPRDPALNALVDLPIEVPFHTIIGQHDGRVKENSSDGVVAYTSSHLDGAASELVVRSGHNVCDNTDAQREVVRILELELRSEHAFATR